MTFPGKLKDTRLTNGYPTIRLPYYVDQYSRYFKQYRYFHPGVDLLCSDVYSFCPGAVLYVGAEDSGYQDVSVQYNATQIVRYKHLKSVAVRAGQAVLVGDPIGIADEYLHFEYCTTQMNKSNYQVRIFNITYYKQDPSIILDDPDSLPMSNKTTVFIDASDNYIDFKFSSQDQEIELGANNSGGGVPLEQL